MSEFNKESDIILCFNYLVYLSLKKIERPCQFYFVEKMLTPEDYRNIHRTTDRFALNWYRINGIDNTVYQNISFGNLVKGTFSRKYMLTVLVKYGEIIRKAVGKWPQIRNVYHDFSNLHNSFFIYNDDNGKFFNKRLLVEMVSRTLGVTSFLITPGSYIPSAHIAVRNPYNADEPLKRKLRNYIKKIISWLNFYAFLRLYRRERIYLYLYFNLSSILSNLSSDFVVNVLNSKNLLPVRSCKYLDFAQIRHKPNFEEKLFLSFLKKTFSQVKESQSVDTDFTYNGINYSAIYWVAINDLVHNVIPNLVKLVGQVKKAIHNCGIKAIVVYEEMDESFQAIIEACHTQGVRSFWVDHGIQGHHHAQKVFESSRSDIVICPGDFYSSYYQSQATRDRQCVVLGNPSLDKYPCVKRKRTSFIKNVLFLTYEDNFYARLDRFVFQERYYEEIFSIFDELFRLGISVFYKPHFENRAYHEYIFKFFGVHMDRINYVDGVSFSELIYKMDLMISNVSSCFYEAQAAGVPTVFLEPYFISDALLPPLNGAQGAEVLRVSSGRELMEIIKSNQNDPRYLNQFLDKFLEKYAPFYMGKLDGMAGKRIIDFLSKNN